MLSPTQGLSLVGGDTWLSCHTEVLLAYFILTTRCCKWQPIYPFRCIVHKTYFHKQKPSNPPSRNKISNQPTTHILSSFCGRYGVLLWLCVFQWTVGEGETKWGKLSSTGLRKKENHQQMLSMYLSSITCVICWFLGFHSLNSLILWMILSSLDDVFNLSFFSNHQWCFLSQWVKLKEKYNPWRKRMTAKSRTCNFPRFTHRNNLEKTSVPNFSYCLIYSTICNGSRLRTWATLLQ